MPDLSGRSILVVDDHGATRDMLVMHLGRLGASTEGARGGLEALQMLRVGRYDLALVDLRMDDVDGLEVLQRAKAEGLDVDIAMMSAEGTVPAAVEAIRLGAADFLVKPFDFARLHDVVGRVLVAADAGPDAPDPRAQWRDRFAPDFIGEAASILEVFHILERIAETDCTVLLLGESGTGKELVARAIHDASNRSQRAMVPVNCGAISETLIESELFGHAKGAFSGATSSRRGRFEVADGSTLFLDEIGEMALSVQVKLLRFLQEGEFVPVGETRPRNVDVRVIAATNRDLDAMAAAGEFREDLFYRLNLIPVSLPPLRERRSDIPIIAQHFLETLGKRRKREPLAFSERAMGALCRYPWPGNVRELQNGIERVILLHRGTGPIEADELPEAVRNSATERPVGLSVVDGSASNDARGTKANDRSDPSAPVRLHRPTLVRDPEPDPFPSAPEPRGRVRLPPEGLDVKAVLTAIEWDLIDQALARTSGNRNRAAQLLGLNRTTLVEKLRKRQRLERARAQGTDED